MEPKYLKKLEGFQTINTIMKTLNIKRSTAIKKVHELRKAGYLTNYHAGRMIRIYRITRNKQFKIGNPGFYDTLNKYSRIKISEPYEHKVFGKRLSVEETIIIAINKKNIRLILASLDLFRHIRDWSKLYDLAKKYNIRRKVGALYDIARTKVRVRKMDKRIRNKLLSTKNEKKYIIKKMGSKDFIDIQKKWKVFIPLNKADLEAYEEWSI